MWRLADLGHMGALNAMPGLRESRGDEIMIGDLQLI